MYSKTNAVILALVAAHIQGPAAVQAIPPPIFGFPDSANHTELTVQYVFNGNTTTVQEAMLFGANSKMGATFASPCESLMYSPGASHSIATTALGQRRAVPVHRELHRRLPRHHGRSRCQYARKPHPALLPALARAQRHAVDDEQQHQRFAGALAAVGLGRHRLCALPSTDASGQLVGAPVYSVCIRAAVGVFASGGISQPGGREQSASLQPDGLHGRGGSGSSCGG